ncbi:polyamine ABC transporter substrate-binding protein [Methylocapsa aurea]|uniref:polyamine ABC transporter substrate-binding protein n=1 Tax=Methylocapsa aurea TaxID=663610 RepID=UPI0005673012|nr:polyamine ABC transporter substrate-binding protein [Methylocapsa aurea]
MRVFCITLWASAICLFGFASPALAQGKVVNVYNWSDYIDPKVLDDFTKETGIKVVYDTFDSNEMLETRLLAGKTGYDVVVPSGPFLQRQIAAGLYQKLDKARLPNSRTLWPEVMARLAVYDPGNQYAVNYMWFTTGIAYNVEKAREKIGDAPLAPLEGALDSWSIIFKPELLKKFADCGVYVLDSPEDLFSTALQYLRLNPDSKSQSDLRRAADLLSLLRRSVTKFHSSEYINGLASGDICLAVGWSGDSFQARNRAREAQNDVEINYIIPREGALMSLDNLAILKDAPHVEEAYAFIDFLLRPEIAARNTNATSFANGVLASKPFINKDILDNKSIYPDAATMSRLFTARSYDQATQRLITREWTRIKTGK